jgi:hypothetical protein
MIPEECLLAPLPRLQSAPAAPKIIERGIQTALYEVTRKKIMTPKMFITFFCPLSLLFSFLV